jgi:hypothetical protein
MRSIHKTFKIILKNKNKRKEKRNRAFKKGLLYRVVAAFCYR